MGFLQNAAKWYKAEAHQMAAWKALEDQLPSYLLEEFVEAYRAAPVVSNNVVLDNTWEGIFNAAKLKGAKYPEVVAAQWALESGWGKYPSGKNNFFGIKGKGTKKQTQEHYGKGFVTVTDEFKDFDTPADCVEYLVKRWYKNYKKYKGVNRAKSAIDCCYLLKSEGYATDPSYSEKLIDIIRKNHE